MLNSRYAWIITCVYTFVQMHQCHASQSCNIMFDPDVLSKFECMQGVGVKLQKLNLITAFSDSGWTNIFQELKQCADKFSAMDTDDMLDILRQMLENLIAHYSKPCFVNSLYEYSGCRGIIRKLDAVHEIQDNMMYLATMLSHVIKIYATDEMVDLQCKHNAMLLYNSLNEVGTNLYQHIEFKERPTCDIGYPIAKIMIHTVGINMLINPAMIIHRLIGGMGSNVVRDNIKILIESTKSCKSTHGDRLVCGLVSGWNNQSHGNLQQFHALYRSMRETFIVVSNSISDSCETLGAVAIGSNIMHGFYERFM
jgi:hypothetical protein